MRLRNKNIRGTKSQQGLAVLEFTFLGTTLLLVLFAIMEISRYMYSMQMLNEITRRAARLATVCYITDRTDIPVLDVIGDLAPSNYVTGNLNIEYLDASGSAVSMEGYEAMSVNQQNAAFSQVKYVRSSIQDLNFSFINFLSFWNSDALVPDFETILPAESLGILRPTAINPNAKTDC